MARAKKKVNKSTTKNKLVSSKNKLTKINKPMNNVLITQLTPELLGCTWLSSVHIKGDGTVELDNSWVELILDFLGMLYESKPQFFMAELSRYNIISESINVMRDIVKYPESSEIKYEVFKLNKTSGYYVEFRHNYEDYIKAIRGLLKALKIDLSKISFNLKPITFSNSDNVQQIIEEKTLAELIEKNKSDFDLTGISIFENKQTVESIGQAVYIFLIWAKTVYGDIVIDTVIHNNESEIGITTAAFIDKYDTRFNKIKFGDYYLYYTNNTKSILNFINQVAMSIGISPELIVLEYKTLQEN